MSAPGGGCGPLETALLKGAARERPLITASRTGRVAETVDRGGIPCPVMPSGTRRHCSRYGKPRRWNTMAWGVDDADGRRGMPVTVDATVPESAASATTPPESAARAMAAPESAARAMTGMRYLGVCTSRGLGAVRGVKMTGMWNAVESSATVMVDCDPGTRIRPPSRSWVKPYRSRMTRVE